MPRGKTAPIIEENGRFTVLGIGSFGSREDALLNKKLFEDRVAANPDFTGGAVDTRPGGLGRIFSGPLPTTPGGRPDEGVKGFESDFSNIDFPKAPIPPSPSSRQPRTASGGGEGGGGGSTTAAIQGLVNRQGTTKQSQGSFGELRSTLGPKRRRASNLFSSGKLF